MYCYNMVLRNQKSLFLIHKMIIHYRTYLQLGINKHIYKAK